MNNESYFYSDIINGLENTPIFMSLKEWAVRECKTTFVINVPLESDCSCDYSDALIILISGKKILFLNFGDNADKFEDYCDIVKEEVSFIARKYKYDEVLGRRKNWERILCEQKSSSEIDSVEKLLEVVNLPNESEKRKADILISLFTGSINDINKIGTEDPKSVLDKVKQKIILFDGDQTRFIYEKTTAKKVVRIQGLSGTGKTELLLHKIKNLYLKNDTDKILLTCYNRILANDLNYRLPKFFDIMKVDKQIDPNRLMCMHSWGSAGSMGTYRYLCIKYNLPFYSLRMGKSFDEICSEAALILQERKSKMTDAEWHYEFDWTFVDECQDFGKGFIDLCEVVTRHRVYVAGDIFQSIFDDFSQKRIDIDYLLSKCYRTDPKTLMFAHGLGMGLFEPVPLKWLEIPEWQNCGYDVLEKKGSNELILKRKPLRRFEDITEEYRNIELIANQTSGFGAVERIIEEIKSIKAQNPSVQAEDICIIFLDNCNETYDKSSWLQHRIMEEFGWSSNKAYESKKKAEHSVQISNRNNVKGLEFSFVICHSIELSRGLIYRNALYTMMTRSFLQTILIVDRMDEELYQSLRMHLDEIQSNGQMTVIEPNEEMKKQISINIAEQNKKKTLNEVFESVCAENKIPVGMKVKLFPMISDLIEDEDFDESLIREAILSNFKVMKGKKR